jgi:hypothetical protein
MKPEQNSRHLLSVTQSKAKMYEYDVPAEYHIDIPRDPTYLFPLSIGMLGDVAVEINNGVESVEKIREIKENLPFSAHFFDAYVQTRLNSEVDYYLLAIGSTAYYLSDLPGSSKLLANRINAH